MTEAYPLQWPQSWPRTDRPQPARFDTSFARARQELLNELRLLGATNIVISSNIMLRQDGLPYANQRQPEDRGIAVYFTLNGEQQCIPCDKWTRTEDNLQAIRKTVQALRGLDRWGAKEMVNAAFRGFKALPEAVIVTPYTKRAWHEVLEVLPTADMDIIKSAWRRKTAKYHPDNQEYGDPVLFQEVQDAYKEATTSRQS